jgi:hypothetical protein
MSRPARPKPKCLVKACKNEHYARGLCKDCYMQAREAIRDGRTTWTELVGMGLAKAATVTSKRWPTKPGPSKFLAALEKAERLGALRSAPTRKN